MPALEAKALLFDLDGTLVDSVDDLVVAINQTLGEINARPLTRDEVTTFIGKGARNMVERSLRAVLSTAPQEDEVESCYRAYVQNMNALDAKYSKLLPYVLESLSSLKASGFRMAVVTNKPSVVIPSLLERFELKGFFDVVLGADSVVHPKPAPDMLQLACERLGVKPSEAFMIGDSMNDALAAQNATIPALLLKTGYNEGIKIEDWVKINTPNFPVFDTMRELTQYLLLPKRS